MPKGHVLCFRCHLRVVDAPMHDDSEEEGLDSYEAVAKAMQTMQLQGERLSPYLAQVNTSLEPLMVYKANFGIVEDGSYVCPTNVSPQTVDNAREHAHNAGLKATKTLEKIRKLLVRVTRDEIPAAQHARYRHMILKKRHRQTIAAKKKAAAERKKYIVEKRNRQAEAAIIADANREDYAQSARDWLAEPDLS